jgi:hypothetical protein
LSILIIVPYTADVYRQVLQNKRKSANAADNEFNFLKITFVKIIRSQFVLLLLDEHL